MAVLLFNKPYGVLSQFTDPEGRPTLKAYIPVARVYPAGRLDLRSEGLLMLSDDPKLRGLLTSQGSKLPREYWVQVEGEPDEQDLQRLREGVWVDGRRLKALRVDRMPAPELWPRTPPVRVRPTSWLRMVLTEGRKHQVRRMTAAIGHPTQRLVRWAIGPFTLHGLAPGQWRYLTPSEEAKLWRLLGRKPTRRRPRRTDPGPHPTSAEK
ncbi:MAG: rRNA pseudouridine synthase [Chloroflexi bacterium]|nr:rRNA pseudouridine synthase [Chloroflexota bacterium]